MSTRAKGMPMLRYVPTTYEESSSRRTRDGDRSVDRPSRPGAADAGANARSPRHRRPRILSRRLAPGIHRHRAGQRRRPRARHLDARRRERRGAPVDVLGQERRIAAMGARWQLHRLHVGSRGHAAALPPAAARRRGGEAHGSQGSGRRIPLVARRHAHRAVDGRAETRRAAEARARQRRQPRRRQGQPAAARVGARCRVARAEDDHVGRRTDRPDRMAASGHGADRCGVAEARSRSVQRAFLSRQPE